ncbi:stage IV sporulation protein FB [Amphibacillus sp. MSJ-3]|uniref:site-2 protease family protein n=1 Tax=Amphibacillus sp. MSJ-3 TaxID=2841505 RepID=UPI001C0EBB36|nr:site-2 protease family protein [Amphibacillus sp. MSJ-3]MBU5593593.1 stage IV sporulation protein FB [Amphibacillus sp. MSJ-3]
MILNKNHFIYLHPSIWFIFILSIMTGMFFEITIIFLIVSWHEFGHYLMAKHFKWDIRRITLWIFGGVMETEEHLNKPMKEQLFVTVSGPLQHLFIFIILLLIQTFDSVDPDLINFAFRYNSLILCFNLIPVWPLDGGKLLNISLNYFFPFKKAYQETIIISLSCLTLLFMVMIHFDQAIINLFVLFTFLIWENLLEWKRRLYVYQRFLLTRMNQKKRSDHLMPLTFTSQTLLKDVFTQLYLNRYHPILIRDRQMVTSESDCLSYYFKKGQHHARLDDLIEHGTK